MVVHIRSGLEADTVTQETSADSGTGSGTGEVRQDLWCWTVKAQVFWQQRLWITRQWRLHLSEHLKLLVAGLLRSKPGKQ